MLTPAVPRRVNGRAVLPGARHAPACEWARTTSAVVLCAARGRGHLHAARARVTCQPLTVRLPRTPAGVQVTRILRRSLTSVAGGGVSNFDGRDRYKLAGRGLTPEEAAERVPYTWDAERFLCPGFLHLLPPDAQIPAEALKDNA